MQWLIDIVLEAVAALGYLTTSFVDRGDVGAWDFTHADLTKDNYWHDLDLSAIVPAGTTAVQLRVQIKDDSIARAIIFRKKGHTGFWNIARLRIQVANVEIEGDIMVPLDNDRKINYLATGAVWTLIGISVRGWWL